MLQPSSPLQVLVVFAAIPVMVALAILVIAYLLVAICALISLAARIYRGRPQPRPVESLSNLLE